MPLPSASLKSLAPKSHAHLQPLRSRAVFRFLSLPAELRRRIYSYLFNNGTIYNLILRSDPSDDHADPQEALHIRLVCRQIHEEATEYIFEGAEVTIETPSIALLEKRLTGITLLEANWRRIRHLRVLIKPARTYIRPAIVSKDKGSHLADLERFLKKYFPPGEEGKVKLKKLCMAVWRECFSDYSSEFRCPRLVRLTGEHPFSRWADGIEGLRNAVWEFSVVPCQMIYGVNCL